jgi:hypothetical protein
MLYHVLEGSAVEPHPRRDIASALRVALSAALLMYLGAVLL